MAYVRRCMIVPANKQVLAQTIAVGLAGEAGANMWETACSTTGTLPATHYITEGWIEDIFAYLLTDQDALYTQCVAAGLGIAQQDCCDLLLTSDVSEEDPFTAMARLNLQLIQEQT